MKVLVPFLLLTSFAFSQEVSEEIQVILREARVHVVGKDGNPVKGLTKDAFTVTENGEAMNVTFFLGVEAFAQT